MKVIEFLCGTQSLDLTAALIAGKLSPEERARIRQLGRVFVLHRGYNLRSSLTGMKKINKIHEHSAEVFQG